MRGVCGGEGLRKRPARGGAARLGSDPSHYPSPVETARPSGERRLGCRSACVRAKREL